MDVGNPPKADVTHLYIANTYPMEGTLDKDMDKC